jgi:hypothetical protein
MTQITEPVAQLLKGKNFDCVNTDERWLTPSYSELD